ncbi:MAG: hypothetical protein R3314_04435 [Longimicrobiales bacterium]|nr:hypothetical protein [Longimicrobiales bacterium]
MSSPGRSGPSAASPSRRPRLAVVALAAVCACGAPAPPSPAPAPPAPSSPARVAVVEDPEATALALGVVVPGSVWELPGTEGLTILAAMTVLETVRPALDSLGARAAVTCAPATFSFTLVAARDVWRPALTAFLDGLFRPAPTPAALARARTRLEASLRLDRASPAWQARLAVRRALYADSLSSGWVGPACGVPEALALLDTADVRAGAYRFASRLAHVAAITPVEGASVEALLRDRLPAGPRPVIPRPRTVEAGRRDVPRNTVTAWVSVAFPFGPDAEIEAVRLLGAVLEDAIAPGVVRPESFAAEHEVERHGAGGTLVIRAVTAPSAAAAYAERIEALATRYAVVGVPAATLDRVARRHRGLRLRQLAAPEARAAGMALQLALGGRPDPWPSLDLTGDQVRAAAGALGVPARSVVGPAPVEAGGPP